MSWTEFVIYRLIASTEGAKMSTLETLLKTQNWGKKVSYSKLFCCRNFLLLGSLLQETKVRHSHNYLFTDNFEKSILIKIFWASFSPFAV